MKKILILLLMIAVICSGQVFPDSSQMEFVEALLEIGDEYFFILLVGSWDLYEKECIDTLRATKFGDEYMIPFEGSKYIKEMVSERQLEERGYKYRYRWVVSTETIPFELDYIFTKEPSFKGFIEFLRAKCLEKAVEQ